MSFGIGVGDILMLSGLAYSIGKTLTSGRTGASAEFHEVQTQLFAISNALKLLSKTLHGSGASTQDHVSTLEDEALIQMIENCSTTLKHLEKVLEKYPELRSEMKVTEDESTRRKWRQELKENVRKIKWTTEGADLDKLRRNLAIHINALNLAVATRGCAQTANVKTQVDITHGMLQDIHEWFLNNLKSSPKQHLDPAPTTNRGTGTSRVTRADPVAVAAGRAAEISIESETITFRLSLDQKGSSSLCRKASFSPEWLSAGGDCLFLCICGKNHRLGYYVLPVSLIVRLAFSRPIWRIHAFSRTDNLVVSILLDNLPSTHLSDFEHEISRLALLQGLRATSTATNSMLIYTSMQNESQGSVSVLRTIAETLGFQQDFERATINSSGLRYDLDLIESVQMLHYMSILFPNPIEAHSSRQKLLPCRTAEIVIHTGSLSDHATDTDIAQLVLNLDHLTVVDDLKSKPSVILKGVNAKATLKNNQDHSIGYADIELAFASQHAADICIGSVRSLQQHVFLVYLQCQCQGESLLFQRDMGDLMIRDMHLIDAQAIVVEHLTTKEQRIIIKSKCGSKSVTMILQPASSESHLLVGSWIAPELPAYFVDISTEDTRIVKQACGNILRLEAPRSNGTEVISDKD